MDRVLVDRVLVDRMLVIGWDGWDGNMGCSLCRRSCAWWETQRERPSVRLATARSSPHALPRLGLLGWVATIHGLEGALAEVRVRESGEGRVGQLKGAA